MDVKKMNVLILGSGAREHALAWRILQSPKLSKLFVAPGNEGTKAIATNLSDVDPEDVEQVVQAALNYKIDLVVVGPEGPLAKGVVNKLQEAGIPVFGPTKEAAELETRKSLALEVMSETHIPHPESQVFLTPEAVVTFAAEYGKPIVVKADGLAGGKGVFVCHTADQILEAARRCMVISPRQPIVVQELLEGREVSVFCFTDGSHISPLVAACNYKRVGEGNTGAMTGGMGSYAWPEFWTDELQQEILNRVMRPVLRAMERRGTPFQGVLYAGLMITNEGPKVLEFNCRFGDPEAQVILPLLITDLLGVMLACAGGELDLIRVEWNHDESTVGVVIASEGYPGPLIGGSTVCGLKMLHPNILVFQVQGGDSGSGRMMTLVFKAWSVEDAADTVYENIRQRLELHNAFCRWDIAAEVLR